MTYDTLLTSSGPLPDTPELESSKKITNNQIKTTTTPNKSRTHRRSQSYNFEFCVSGKSKVQLNINCTSPVETKKKQLPASNTSSSTDNKNISPVKKESFNYGSRGFLEDPPLMQTFFTYLCYTVLRWFGNLRDLMRSSGLEARKGAKDNNSGQFAPLFSSFENFFTQNFYMRGRDCFNRPICGVPGAEIELIERETSDHNWTFQNTGKTKKVLNMGSYNYLGFAENTGETSESVQDSIRLNGVSTCSPRQELGTLAHHNQLEHLLATFLRKDRALVFGMGFAVNAVNIPALVDKNCLIMSDELNHTSLILGSRLSGAHVKTFKHNSPADLESKLRLALIEGHPRTGRAWKKVLIVVEGIYSMEGTILDLPEIVKIKKKYRAYLYLDEAHSIGALGDTGRGICEHWGVDTSDVDVLMGTFSKSFGASGGYIAGSYHLINHLQLTSHAQAYASSMSPPVCTQILRTLSIIMGLDNTNQGQLRIQQLHKNSIYFRDKLVKMGFIVYGDPHSPIVPLMLYLPTKCVYFNRLMLDRGIAVVSVGFPATSLLGGRTRFCMSAAHTREMLDRTLDAIDYCGGIECNSKISRLNRPRTMREIRQIEENEV